MSDDAVTALSFFPCWHSVATLICYDVIVMFVGNDQFLHKTLYGEFRRTEMPTNMDCCILYNLFKMNNYFSVKQLPTWSYKWCCWPVTVQRYSLQSNYCTAKYHQGSGWAQTNQSGVLAPTGIGQLDNNYILFVIFCCMVLLSPDSTEVLDQQ